MHPSLSKLAQTVGLQPEAPKRAQSVLLESYLSLIDGQNRRLAAEERAIEEERLYLAELPESIADLDRRIEQETAPDLIDILRAKRDEAQSEFDILQRRMIEREAAWPARKSEMMADIARFHEKLGQATVARSR